MEEMEEKKIYDPRDYEWSWEEEVEAYLQHCWQAEEAADNYLASQGLI